VESDIRDNPAIYENGYPVLRHQAAACVEALLLPRFRRVNVESGKLARQAGKLKGLL
jgi:hypothetical protein